MEGGDKNDDDKDDSGGNDDNHYVVDVDDECICKMSMLYLHVFIVKYDLFLFCVLYIRIP